MATTVYGEWKYKNEIPVTIKENSHGKSTLALLFFKYFLLRIFYRTRWNCNTKEAGKMAEQKSWLFDQFYAD